MPQVVDAGKIEHLGFQLFSKEGRVLLDGSQGGLFEHFDYRRVRTDHVQILSPMEVFLGQIHAYAGNIDKFHLPATLSQPKRMASYTAGNVQGDAGLCAGQKFRVSGK